LGYDLSKSGALVVLWRGGGWGDWLLSVGHQIEFMTLSLLFICCIAYGLWSIRLSSFPPYDLVAFSWCFVKEFPSFIFIVSEGYGILIILHHSIKAMFSVTVQGISIQFLLFT
jgi:hypothetical protein